MLLSAKLQEARNIAEIALEQVTNDRKAAVEAYRAKVDEIMREVRRSRSATRP